MAAVPALITKLASNVKRRRTEDNGLTAHALTNTCASGEVAVHALRGGDLEVQGILRGRL
jgi:hypothetical protein